MSAHIIDGKALAETVRAQVAQAAAHFSQAAGRPPSLSVVHVGDDPVSATYVRTKARGAQKCGIAVEQTHLDGRCTADELISFLLALSGREELDAILLQLPLPPHLDSRAALLAIAPSKDVDGLHPANQGLLATPHPGLVPCTAAACLALVEQGRVLLGKPTDLSGLRATVIGRSALVGNPTALLLTHRNCTVTLCHRRTLNLATHLQHAEIVVSAAGHSGLVRGEDLMPGAIVVDVGINRSETGGIVGDVDYPSASAVAGAITPVPGGVGPMTVAMLLSNVVQAARARLVI